MSIQQIMVSDPLNGNYGKIAPAFLPANVPDTTAKTYTVGGSGNISHFAGSAPTTGLTTITGEFPFPFNAGDNIRIETTVAISYAADAPAGPYDIQLWPGIKAAGYAGPTKTITQANPVTISVADSVLSQYVTFDDYIPATTLVNGTMCNMCLTVNPGLVAGTATLRVTQTISKTHVTPLVLT